MDSRGQLLAEVPQETSLSAIEDLVYLILSRKDDVTKPGELNTFLDRLGSDTENDSEVIESGSSEKTTTFYSTNPCKHYKNSSF